MPNIFLYTDYREFIGDYYKDQKKLNKSFSYQNFSHKAGFTSKSFVFNVIKGKKNLSRQSIVSLAEAMNLTKTEADYFENLVSLNQANTYKEKDFYLQRLNAVRPQNTEASKAKKLRQDQFDLYGQWYNVALRSLLDLAPVKDNYKLLARKLYPAISAKQAHDSIKLLQRLDLAIQQKDGTWKITDKLVTTGPEVQSLAVQNFHIQTLDLAAKAIRELPRNERNISSLTLGISRQAYEHIVSVLYDCQEKILGIAEKDQNSDTVYQLNFQIFPVSLTPAAPAGKEAGI